MNPTLKAPGCKRLKLKCDELLSNFAFKFNLRRYIKTLDGVTPALRVPLKARGVHSSTSHLNLSFF
jgi:hypothetical protein